MKHKAAPPRGGGQLLAGLLQSQPKPLGLAAGLATVAAALELAPYWLVYRMAVEATARAPDSATLALLAGLILAAAVLRLLLFGAANVVSHRLAFRLQKELRISLVRALDRLTASLRDGR